MRASNEINEIKILFIVELRAIYLTLSCSSDHACYQSTFPDVHPKVLPLSSTSRNRSRNRSPQWQGWRCAPSPPELGYSSTKFTRSQTMKVEILSVSGDVSLPTHAILKLYDHRYLSDRVNKEARDPWDADREKKAERIRKLLQEKKDVIEGRMPGPPRGFVLPPEQSALSSEEGHSSSEAGESESSTEEVGENKYFRILVNALEEVSPSDL